MSAVSSPLLRAAVPCSASQLALCIAKHSTTRLPFAERSPATSTTAAAAATSAAILIASSTSITASPTAPAASSALPAARALTEPLAGASTRLRRAAITINRSSSSRSIESSPPAPPSANHRPPAAMAKTVRVDVTSDTVCPWCYVGKKNLEAAIAQLPDDIHVEVAWHPFQLNPQAPQEGVNKEQFFREKFGPRVPAMVERMSQIFAGFGHKYSQDGKTGNTLDSHRLLWYARHSPQGSPALQNALAEELFLDYFTRAQYIGDRVVLVAAAERVGLLGAREFVEDDSAGRREVEQEMREFGRGVTGVPFFRVADQQLSGAQPPEVFVRALKDAVKVEA